MILKSVVSYVLRISSGISGIVPVDEVKEGEPEREVVTEEWDPAEALPGGLDETLVTRFRVAIEDAYRVDPSLWGRAKVQMYGPSIETDEALEALVERIEKETAEERERRTPAAEVEEEVDAEIVPEEETSGPSSNLSADEIESLRHEEADLTAKLDELSEADEDFEGTKMRLDEVRAELADVEEPS
jgi:hypothetical protein